MAADRILIVDDSPSDAAILTRYLTRDLDGLYELARAERGDTGLRLAEEFRPAVVLLDFDLPDASGLEVLAALRQRYGDLAPTVLAITGQPSPRIAAEFVRNGAFDYISKSEMSEESVRLAVRQALRMRNLRADLDSRTRERELSRLQLVSSLQRASFLAGISEVLMRSLDAGSVLGTVAHLSLPHLGNACFVDVLDGSLLTRHTIAADDDFRARAGSIDLMRAPFPDGGEGVPRALRSSGAATYNAAWLPAVARGDAVIADLLAADAIASLIVVPLVFDEHALGALSFVSLLPHDAHAQGVAEELGRRASAAVANARAFERQREATDISEAARRRMMVIVRVSEVFTRSLEWREALAAAADSLVPSFCDTVAIAIDDGGLRTVALSPADDAALRVRTENLAVTPPSSFTLSRAQRTMTVAIVGANGTSIGTLTVRHLGPRYFELDDLALASDLGRRAGMYLENARQFEREREIARSLQKSLLPLKLPDVAGVVFAARCLAGVQGVDVGGDWYDVVRLSPTRVAFAVGDVSGRGVLAAAIMGQLRSSLRAYVLEGLEPGDALARLNMFMLSQERMQFATVGLGVLDTATGIFRYASAGHLPPLIVEDDGTASFLETATSLPVGAMDDTHYEQSEHLLAPDATLSLFTDGLIESRTRPIDAGLAELLAVAREAHASTESFVEAAIARLSETSADFSDDDVTMLSLRFEPADREGLARFHPPSIAATYPAIASAAPAIRKRLTKFLREIGFPKEHSHNVLLGSGEAVANAIQHAYAGVTQVGLVSLRANLTDGELTVEVTDNGVWRQPRESDLPPIYAESGRGIALMHLLCDRANVQRAGSGTRVRLHFAHSVRETALV